MSPDILMGISLPMDFVPTNTLQDDSDDEDLFFYDARVSLDDKILASFVEPIQNNVCNNDIF